MTPPFTPGAEISGIVTKIGKDVENFKVGDKVYGSLSAFGAF